MIETLESKILEEVPTDDSTSREEKMILHDEIKKLNPKVIVESGTHRGLTTLYMLCAVADGHLHTADPYEWGARGNFRKFPELEQKVTYYQMPASQMIEHLEEKVDFAFIDGFHEKIEVLKEMEKLLPKLADGAVVYFHDTNGSNDYCDVVGAIAELGLTVDYLKTSNGMAKYVHNKGGDSGQVHDTEVKKRKARKTVRTK